MGLLSRQKKYEWMCQNAKSVFHHGKRKINKINTFEDESSHIHHGYRYLSIHTNPLKGNGNGMRIESEGNQIFMNNHRSISFEGIEIKIGFHHKLK